MSPEISGCTDSNATNYNSNATIDDGSCMYAMEIEGCTDPAATNYNPNATVDDDSCIYSNDCASPNYLNFEISSNSVDNCETIEYIGDLTISGRPFYTFGSEESVIIAAGENSNVNLKFDLNDKSVSIFPSTIYNADFKRDPISEDTGTEFMSLGANELRRDELFRFTNDGIKMYTVSPTEEITEFYPFDVRTMIPIQSGSGHEYRWPNRIQEIFKVDGYIYVWFFYGYSNFNNNTVYYREFMIRCSNYGAGNWEYIGEFGVDINLISSLKHTHSSDIIVTDSGRVLFVGKSNMHEFNTNTNSFTTLNIAAPTEYRENQRETPSFKGLLCSEYSFNGNKEYVHYAYSNTSETTSEYKFWFYVSSLDSWFETNENLNFGQIEPRLRGTSIYRTDLGANLFFNVNQEGQMFLFSPN